MRFPEIRVTRVGPRVESVVWDPCVEGADVFDMTGMRVANVATQIKEGDIPAVTVTFLARLVDAEAPS